MTRKININPVKCSVTNINPVKCSVVGNTTSHFSAVPTPPYPDNLLDEALSPLHAVSTILKVQSDKKMKNEKEENEDTRKCIDMVSEKSSLLFSVINHACSLQTPHRLNISRIDGEELQRIKFKRPPYVSTIQRRYYICELGHKGPELMEISVLGNRYAKNVQYIYHRQYLKRRLRFTALWTNNLYYSVTIRKSYERVFDTQTQLLTFLAEEYQVM